MGILPRVMRGCAYFGQVLARPGNAVLDGFFVDTLTPAVSQVDLNCGEDERGRKGT